MPEESPFSGLSFGMNSFSLRETGAEKLKVKEPNVRRRSEQIDLGGHTGAKLYLVGDSLRWSQDIEKFDVIKQEMSGDQMF